LLYFPDLNHCFSFNICNSSNLNSHFISICPLSTSVSCCTVSIFKGCCIVIKKEEEEEEEKNSKIAV
jgi:hypothetical protein